ncbi:hypothetical protein [Bacillus thuringiensis]|uniref:hypothetical protein n=1 Tax=Bacillus thuringiensis TaxID=1428 RepID=UPI001596C7FC|nr:hypothetical protein [Bacillus thuringiensis]
MAKVTIEIDVNEDFDGIDLEEAIGESEGKTKEILMIIHHKWVTNIGKPEWSLLDEN